MSGIADTNTIDVVAQHADGHYLLVIVEERSWGADLEQPAQLRAKINAYTGFILDGSLAQRYPETAGQRVDIQLDCREEPRGEIAIITEHTTRQLKRLGVDFRVNVRS